MGRPETALRQEVGLRRAVFLDRDGVLNRAVVRDGKPYPPSRVGEFELMPGVIEGCRRLKEAGFLLVVATNQPDVGRGHQSRAVVEEMHRLLAEAVPLDGIEVCYDGGPGPSEFSKPAPGMLLKAARERGIDLRQSYMIGDRWRDVDCGQAAGCVTIFMDHDYRESLNQPPDYLVGTFLQAVNVILATANPGMTSLTDLRVKIFADGADKKGILEFYRDPLIKGLTTNPSLMRKEGISDYEAFARDILETVTSKPISFEVFSDDFSEMRRQARLISQWQSNVYVKIPITNTRGEPSVALIRELAKEGVKMNVTALLTVDQVRAVAGALQAEIPSVVSLFGGRIADTSRDPVAAMTTSLEILRTLPKAELLWGSCREVLNIRQADESGVHIITVTHDVLKKAIKLWGQDLGEVSLDTVKMFHEDAKAAGYKL